MARAIVARAFVKMLNSATALKHISKLVFIAARDWDEWDDPAQLGAYYRARAVQAAIHFTRRVESHRLNHPGADFEFGDFPVRIAFFITLAPF